MTAMESLQTLLIVVGGGIVVGAILAQFNIPSRRGPGIPANWIRGRYVGIGSGQYRIPRAEKLGGGYWCDSGGMEIDYSRRNWWGSPKKKWPSNIARGN